MDCEKLDQHVIDALYGELDELTQAALERHAEGCSRCGPLYAGLKATRAVAVLPLEEPPADLEARILAAAALQMEAPRRGRLVRLMAWTRTRALGPQLAAAAVFLLVIGSSLVVLQTKSSSPDRSAAPAIIAPESAPAATAAAQAAPPPYPYPAAYPSPVVASEPSAEARKIEGEPPAAPASAAATPAASASAAQPKLADGQAAAIGGEKVSPAAKAAGKPAAAKPPPRSGGGTNPRAPAAPMYNDAFK